MLSSHRTPILVIASCVAAAMLANVFVLQVFPDTHDFLGLSPSLKPEKFTS